MKIPKIRMDWLVFLFFPLTISAQIAGPANPNAFSNLTLFGYSRQWTNISNAQFEDETYASFGNLPEIPGSHTDYLAATDFGFQIPAGTIIKGIKVEVKCFDPNSRTSDYSVRIIKTGNITGLEKATGTAYPVTDNYITYGGPDDLWGETWDYKFIDDNHFGVAISAQRNTGDNFITNGQVNNIRITVYYTYTTLPLTLVEFSATRTSQSIKLTWQTRDESGMEKFIVEKSSDALNFRPLVQIAAQNLPSTNYSFMDLEKSDAVVYYRLRMDANSGLRNYSKILLADGISQNQLFLYPSPWDKEQQLSINNNKNQRLTIFFLNGGGQVLSTAITESSAVPTQTLVNRKGLFYYKIFDSKKKLLGSGSLLISL